jgi:hypothetical protein
MNKDAEYYENLDLFGCFGDQGSLEVAIRDHGSLEVAHIFSFVSFYYLIASDLGFRNDYKDPIMISHFAVSRKYC